MSDQSLRGFVEMVQRDFPDDFVRISAPVRRDLDITSAVFELERSGKYPVVMFDDVEGFDLPVVTNVAGNRQLLAAAMGTSPDDLPLAYRERCQNYQPVEVVGDAPFEEIVLEGDDVDIFVVETDANGVKRNPYRLVDGRGAADLELKDVVVPLSARLTSGGDAVAILSEVEDWAVLTMAAESLGAMECAKDLTLEYLKTRQQFGQPIGEFQLMQGKLADMYTTTNACKSYVYTVARACDKSRVTRKDAAGAILYAAEKATLVALDAIQCLGGNGYINDYPTGRYLRDAKLYEIGAGTSEIRRMLIGREIFEETK